MIIARNRITIVCINDGKPGDPGKDAISYSLVPRIESVLVENASDNANIVINLQYIIQKSIGQKVTTISSLSAEKLSLVTDSTKSISFGWTGSCYQATARWRYKDTPIEQITVKLMRDSEVMVAKVIKVAFKNSVYFEVNKDLSSISGTVKSLNGRQTKIEQKIGSLSSSVEDKVSKTEYKQTSDGFSMVINRLTNRAHNLLPQTMYGTLGNTYGCLDNVKFNAVPGKTYTLTVEGRVSQKLLQDKVRMHVFIFSDSWNWCPSMYIKDTNIKSHTLTFTIPTNLGFDENTKFNIDIYPTDLNSDKGLQEYASDFRVKELGSMYIKSMWLNEGTEQNAKPNESDFVWHENLLQNSSVNGGITEYNGYSSKNEIYGKETPIAASQSPSGLDTTGRYFEIPPNGDNNNRICVFEVKLKANTTYTFSIDAIGVGRISFAMYRKYDRYININGEQVWKKGYEVYSSQGVISNEGNINNNDSNNISVGLDSSKFTRKSATIKTRDEDVYVIRISLLRDANNSQTVNALCCYPKLEEYGFATPAMKPITAKALQDMGLFVNENKIVGRSDNFEVQNSKGEKTFTINKDGDLEASGGAKFFGMVSFGKTIINSSNARVYIQKGTYGGIRIDKMMPRIVFIGESFPQVDLALPVMFERAEDGKAVMGGFDLGLSCSEWNDVCRRYAGNYFYLYNHLTDKIQNTICFWSHIENVPTRLKGGSGYTRLSPGRFICFKCEIGESRGFEQLIWKYVSDGKCSV